MNYAENELVHETIFMIFYHIYKHMTQNERYKNVIKRFAIDCDIFFSVKHFRRRNPDQNNNARQHVNIIIADFLIED